jgi:hypothetical protein
MAVALAVTRAGCFRECRGLATSEGLSLTKAFTAIKDKTLRRCIVDLVEGITDQ